MSHPLTLAAVAAVALLSVRAAGAIEVSQTVTTTAPPAKVAGIIGRFDAGQPGGDGVEASDDACHLCGRGSGGDGLGHLDGARGTDGQ